MVIRRGDIWLADFGDINGSRPALIRPFVVLQADFINRIRISTVFGLSVTSNLALAELTGNVVLEVHDSGLPKISVVNMTQISTLNKTDLLEFIHHLSDENMARVEAGVKRVMGLA